jgi:hypothetical protein
LHALDLGDHIGHPVNDVEADALLRTRHPDVAVRMYTTDDLACQVERVNIAAGRPRTLIHVG